MRPFTPRAKPYQSSKTTIQITRFEDMHQFAMADASIDDEQFQDVRSISRSFVENPSARRCD